MADVVPPATRSLIMSRIRRKDTAPEILVRSYLFAKGLRFRVNVRGLPGSPDIVLPSARTVVFVHGCFWHQHPSTSCPHTGLPKARRPYWRAKFARNARRDARKSEELRRAGWRVEVVWECQATSGLVLSALTRRLAARRHARN